MESSNHNKPSIMWKDYEEAVYEECERVYHFSNAEIIKDIHIIGKYSGELQRFQAQGALPIHVIQGRV